MGVESQIEIDQVTDEERLIDKNDSLESTGTISDKDGSIESAGIIHAVITRRGTDIGIPIYLTEDKTNLYPYEVQPYIKNTENVFFSKSDLPKRNSKVAKCCLVITILVIMVLVGMALGAGVQKLCGGQEQLQTVDADYENSTILLINDILIRNKTEGLITM